MATAQATSTPQPSFPTKGSFKRIPFPRLLREIARSKLTGNLYLLSEETKKVVFFEEGQPTFVRSNVLSECLGQVLAQEGLITSEQCEQTLEAIRRTGKKQGELLVEMGILSEGNLRYGLEAQLRTKLYEIFGWDDGRYQFKQDATSTAFSVRLGLSAEGIIIDAIQERYGDERARQVMKPIYGQFPIATDGDGLGETVALLDEERWFAQSLDGSRTIEELLSEPIPQAVSAPAALLLGLIYAGFAELATKPRPRRPRQPPPRSSNDGRSDDAFRPTFEARNTLTEYEDTPLPGVLPSARGILGDHEADFAGVEADMDASGRLHVPARQDHDALHELVAAEPDEFEETFEEGQLELHGEDDVVDDLDDVELLDDHSEIPQPPPPPAGASPPPAPAAPHDELGALLAALDAPLDLMSPEELDALDLAANARARAQNAVTGSVPTLSSRALPPPTGPRRATSDAVAAGADNPEILGAIRFNEAETAMAAKNYGRAAELLEDAFKHGFDVAELHAMLAYARFMRAGGTSSPTATHALELLDYAEGMDPSLDLVHAYRGAILVAIHQPTAARAALQRALELNPYSEIAIQLMDELG